MPPYDRKPRAQVNNLEINPLQPSTLNPAALDSYIRPGSPEIQAPPNSNPMTKLAESLGALAPLGDELLKRGVAERDKRSVAEVEADFHANRDKWNENIKAGTVPLGVSPWAARAAHRLYLKEMASEYQSSSLLAFQTEEGAAARESNNPQDMKAFLQKQKDRFRSKLENDQGKALFSPLDLQEVWTPELARHDSELMRLHASHRVQETEKQLVDAVATGMQASINRHLELLDPKTDDPKHVSETYDRAAREIEDLFHNPDSGAITNGLPGSKATQLMIDHITGEAIRTGDMSRLNLLDHLKTKDGASIGNTRYALDKRTHAEERITQTEMQRAHFAQWQKNLGFEDATRAHQQTVWAREDERYARELQAVHKQEGEQARQENVGILERRALDGLRRGAVNGPQVINQALRDLAQVDPSAAVRVEGWIHELQRLRLDTPEDPVTIATIRKDISINPDKVSYDSLVGKVRAKQISAPTMMRLASELDEAKKNNAHPYMRSSEFQSILQAVHTSTLDPVDPNSPDSQQQALGAVGHMRDLATAYIQEHPSASDAQFRVFLRGQVKPTLEQFKTEYGQQEQKKRGEAEKAKGEAVVNKAQQIEREKAEAKRQAEEDQRQAELDRLKGIALRAEEAFKVLQQKRKLQDATTPTGDTGFDRFRDWLLGK
ncbi:MAG: hypothetical protein U0223_16840 [Nitrospira sp.]|nr:hypothetical protein [Nitrospira sp.]